MRLGSAAFLAILLGTSARAALAGDSSQPDRVRIDNSSDLPPHAYVARGKPSDVVQDDEAVLALALQMEKDLVADLGKYDIRDDTVLQRIYSSLYWIGMLKKDHAAARRYLELVRERQGNSVGRMLTGVITIPYMEAMDHPGADFHAAFRALLSEGLTALPYVEVVGTLRAMKDNMAMISKAQTVGSVVAGLDPAVQEGRLSQEMAQGVVSAAMNLQVILRVKDDAVAVLEKWFQDNETALAAANPAGKISRTVSQTLPDGPYFGQEPPGPEPKVFAPGVVSLPDRREMKVIFSPDNRESLIGIGNGFTFELLQASRVGRHWSPVSPAGFVTTPGAQEPFFSPDGQKIFFTSHADIYVSTRADTTWTAPVKLGPPVNTEAEEYHPTVTSDGTLYFCSMRDNPNGDIFRARREDGGYSTAEKLDATINARASGQKGAYDPYIAPDETYIIFSAVRSDGHGKGDFHISYRTTDGSWTPPKNLGPAINTDQEEYGAYVGPDEKYFFFARPSGWGPRGPADIYWVRADFLATPRRQPSTGN